jgi:O-methyltransferase
MLFSRGATVNPRLSKVIKEVLFNSPLRRFSFPGYVYEFTPPQLCFLCQSLEETRHLEGSVFEVGCSNGATTVFLNKYMDAQGISKPYYAIDTFSGFVTEDVQYEIANRSKTTDMYSGRFTANKKKWFDATVRQHGITRVQSIEADVNKFDLRSLGPISFALLDVDLYRPIKKALPELHEMLAPGGIIVVDDCDAGNVRWDGADQAYKEFMEGTKRPAQIIHRKLGVVRKTA